MDAHLIGLFSVLSITVLSAGTLLYLLAGNRRSSNLIQSLGSGAAANAAVRDMQREGELAHAQFELLKEATRRKIVTSANSHWEDRYFRAGIFSQFRRKTFQQVRVVLPVILTLLGTALGFYFSSWMMFACGFLGLAIGLQLPLSYLNRVISRRNEEIMYFLPLVIDQLVIGVSGSLDISPCIASVVAMADERDTHNPVSELLRYAQNYVKSGASLEEALTEVGVLSGHTELKHVFMSLSQVSKHGGEITRQLQELAIAVSQQREAKIESKIKTLELEATGPVGLVFIAFLGTLLIGIGTQMMEAFK